MCQAPTTAERASPTASFPSRPWEKVGADLFELYGKRLIAIVDDYSRWLEIKKVPNEISENIVQILKEVFSTHGIPDMLIFAS